MEGEQVAHALQTHGAVGARSNWLEAIRAAVVLRIKWFAAYRTTYNELSALSDRDLADLDLSREALKAISRQAAYDAVL